MVKIGTVWDSTLEAVRGRAGVIAPIALVALFLPRVAQAAMANYGAEPGIQPGVGVALLRMLIAIGTLLLTLWGALAITAITSDPDVTRPRAARLATTRLLPLLGVSVVLGLALGLLALPLFGLLTAAGVDMARMSTPGYRPELSGGAAAVAVLYMLVLLGLLFWLLARLMPLVPVVLHERLGLRAIGRAFRLTRGLALKLIGVLILFAIVLGVTTGAAQLVVGLVFRLVLGSDNIPTATFLGGVAGAAVGAVLSVISYVFCARLYVMLGGRERSPLAGDVRAAT